jgi:hypothetical protein
MGFPDARSTQKRQRNRKENKEDAKKKDVTFGRTVRERGHERNHLILKFSEQW